MGRSATAAKHSDRREQLRLAKRRQRERERQRGMETYQLRLPRQLAGKLKEGLRQPAFRDALYTLIDHRIVHAGDYANLRLLTWNRTTPLMARAEAFALYESNWRHVDANAMSEAERDLVRGLVEEFGNGVIHA